MRTTRFLLALALPILLAGCAKDGIEPPMPGGTGEITFEIGFAPQTRVSTGADFKSAWENGDEIGVFAVRRTSGGNGSLSATNYIDNVKLTYDGSAWTAAAPLYFPPGTDVLDFYAYYPYDASATDPTAIVFNVMADQSGTTDGKSNYNLSDLLTSKSDNSGAGWGKGSTVGLTFSHALAMVQVSVPSGGKGFGPSEGLTVMLRGIQPGAALNLANISTTAGSEITVPVSGNDAASITMYRVEQPTDANYETTYTYRALVPAQDVAVGGSLFWFEHEGRQLLMDGALAQAFQMTAGQAETFTRTLPAMLIHTVAVPAGTFLMGSPDTEPNRQSNETQHSVTLTKDFRMGKYPVTFAQYDAFCEATSRSKPDDWGWGRGDRPVINVSWDDAAAYAAWVGGALPTEAQWEYAARGGQTESLPFGIGDGTELYADMANFYGTYPYELPGGTISSYDGLGGHPNTRLNKTTEVGTYPYANGYGLYDMHGNVFEWCADWYGDYPTGTVTDPTGAASGSDRVLRGGSWSIIALNCRSAIRYGVYPGYADYSVGFRVVFPAP